MKATGIVRRIDDLDRVVTPKEIRRTMRICEGDLCVKYAFKIKRLAYKFPTTSVTATPLKPYSCPTYKFEEAQDKDENPVWESTC